MERYGQNSCLQMVLPKVLVPSIPSEIHDAPTGRHLGVLDSTAKPFLSPYKVYIPPYSHTVACAYAALSMISHHETWQLESPVTFIINTGHIQH